MSTLATHPARFRIGADPAPSGGPAPEGGASPSDRGHGHGHGRRDTAPAPVPLSTLRTGRGARVIGLLPDPQHSETQAAPDTGDGIPALPEQLADLGFTAGEPVMILRRAWLGGDPLAVRIGTSTFALRRAEADLVLVEPDPER